MVMVHIHHLIKSHPTSSSFSSVLEVLETEKCFWQQQAKHSVKCSNTVKNLPNMCLCTTSGTKIAVLLWCVECSCCCWQHLLSDHTHWHQHYLLVATPSTITVECTPRRCSLSNINHTNTHWALSAHQALSTLSTQVNKIINSCKKKKHHHQKERFTNNTVDQQQQWQCVNHFVLSIAPPVAMQQHLRCFLCSEIFKKNKQQLTINN